MGGVSMASDSNGAPTRRGRRSILAALATSAVGAVVVACSSSAPASTPAAAPTTAPAAAAPTTAAASPTAASAATLAATTAAAPSGAGTINHYLSGDVNIHDLWTKSLIPAYQKVNPNVKINLVFDEHGSGDATTFDRIAAAKQASKVSGVDTWETGGYLQQGGQAGLIVKLSE